MKNYYLLLFFLAVCFASEGQVYTVETVPNTKLINNSYVSDPDQLLSSATVEYINMMLDSVERRTTSQVAVVMLKSIGETDHIDFAQKLFEKWGIGQKINNNGLLILYIEDQRTIRFHTGFGLEGVLPDATCKRIQMKSMVPRFKEGRIDEGMLAGINDVSFILLNPDSKEIIAADESGNGIIYKLLGLPYVLVLLIVLFGFMRINRKTKIHFQKEDFRSAYDYLTKKEAYRWWVILFPLPFAFLFNHFKKLKDKARKHARNCKKCGTKINSALSEAKEDEYLSKENIFEENLKSVDYDVWKCPSCQDVVIERYISSRTKYSQCASCSTYALYTASSYTKVAATTTSTGVEEITKICKYCNHKTITHQTIPKISTSDSGSSSSGSGGSWGGGDSGGGGSSSSW